jgi:hypothetical protein
MEDAVAVGRERLQTPERVAAGRLDLRHLRPELPQHVRAERAGQEPR